MEILEFEKAVNEVVPKTKDDWGFFQGDLKMWLCADGCLSASYNGELVPSEGYSWDKALDVILEHIKRTEEQDGE